MLDLTLIKLMEAGLLSVSIPDSIPYDPPAEPGHLLASLDAANRMGAQELVKATVAVLWQASSQIGLPADLMEAHTAHLANALAATRLSTDEIVVCLGSEREPQGNTDPLPVIDSMIDRITSSPATDDLVDTTVLRFLAETFLDAMYRERTAIIDLQPGLAKFVAATRPRKSKAAQPTKLSACEFDLELREVTDTRAALEVPPAQPRRIGHDVLRSPGADGTAARDKPPPLPSTRAIEALAQVAEADRLGVSVGLLEAINSRVHAKCPAATPHTGALKEAVAIAHEINDSLGRLQRSGLKDGHLVDASREHLAAGRLGEAERALATAEDLAVRSAQDDFQSTRNYLHHACEIRLCRALLEQLRQDTARAARSYRFARRYLHREDHIRRCRLAMKEARLYENAALRTGQPEHVEGAARAWSEVLETLPDEIDPHSRLNAQLDLAHNLLIISQQRNNAIHCDRALTLLAEIQAQVEKYAEPTYRLRAQLLLADGWAIASQLRTDPAVARDALFSYQTIRHGLEAYAAPEATSISPSLIDAKIALAMIIAGVLERELEPVCAGVQNLQTLIAEWPKDAGWNDLGARLVLARCHLALARWHNGTLGSFGDTARSASDLNLAADHYRQAAQQFQRAGSAEMHQLCRETLSSLELGNNPQTLRPDAA